MLKFWKKPGLREKQPSSATSSPTKSQKSVGSPTTNGGSYTGELFLNLEELEEQLKTTNYYTETSRLSRSLDEVLSDSSALGYFIQYLEAVQCSALIKFWLDVTSFEASLASCDKNCDSDKNLQSHDAAKIFEKYFSTNSCYKIDLPTDIRDDICNELQNCVNISKQLFAKAKTFVYTTFKNEHFNEFLRSEFHCKYQIELLTSSQILLSDILYNETALFYFMEYLEQEGSRCLLEFWMAANNFKQQYECDPHFDPVHAQDDAVVLYDKYFSLQATSPLNLGDKIRLEIEESICREGGPLATCFEHPQRLIVLILQTKYLEPFTTSQLYFKYLSELITTIQASPTSRAANSAGSDCGSEVSISTTNTLLVSEDVNPPKKYYHHLHASSMNIDTRQLYDPDSLWRRTRTNKLMFGSVDELGRYKTDMEPEPDKKEDSRTRITKAMKKLVNMEEDKSKEEMAWQVAAMIIKDVTAVTMSSHDHC